MHKHVIRAFTLVLFGGLLAGPAQAASAGFACAFRQLEGGDALAADLKPLLPRGEALNDADNLNNAVSALRQRKVRDAVIVDSLVSAYCPVVADDGALTAAQKATKVQRYAMRVSGIVYAPPDAEAILLTVPLAPSVANKVNAKAQAVGVTPDTWIANAVSAALQTAQ
ncbi:hypothetical protein [Chelatococcus reniformis]|nr:hypothetical protein [Chelatococcus reniformis]